MLNCNRSEAGQLLGHPLHSLRDAIEAGGEIRERGPNLVTVTLGAEGLIACSQQGCWHLTPPTVRVVNAVGAGDALVAGMAVGLVRHLPTEELLCFSQTVAAATLTHWHAGALRSEDVPLLLPRVGIRKLEAAR